MLKGLITTSMTFLDEMTLFPIPTGMAIQVAIAIRQQ